MAKIKIGDIFEINTNKGKAYLHFIFKDASLGELIRVLDGLFPGEPPDLDQLVAQDEQFMVFFPLSAAHKKGIVSKVGFSSAEPFEKPKFMRTEHMVQGDFLGWHIINTETWQRELVKTLNHEQEKLSPWGIWNDTQLVERLTAGWNLVNWK